MHTRCCIAGGGPAGLVLGYLLARSGVDVVVLEKHDDFLRDFRGDTIHPSTLQVLDDVGLLERFLALPHQEIAELTGDVFGETVVMADFRHLPAPRPFLVLVPQWDFLDFIATEARRFPHFRLRMGAKVTRVLEEGGRVAGVEVQERGSTSEIRADLVVAADGRHTTVRESAGLTSTDFGAPIDVLWFRLPRTPEDPARTGGILRPGAMLVTLNRDAYWQCAFVIPKGSLQELRDRGLPAFRARVAEISGFLGDVVDQLASWDDVKLLSVQISRMPRWWRDGLLCIGDAAHAMSPVGGVGINLAIQDAVAAANLLALPLRDGRLAAQHLQAVQRRREWPTRVTQRMQVAVQDALLSPLLARTGAPAGVPAPVRLLQRLPLLRRIPARVIGMGVRPERVRLPPAG
jgi:2-polyprenyl-6-methoxyphenol hydroxylase-like FAD-dependent oxidoreductase